MKDFTTLEQYLQYIGQFRRSDFGRRFRAQFRDSRGTAELAMLKAPTEDEYAGFQRAVAAMTNQQKQNPENLSDQQIQNIAQEAQLDSGSLAIFLNGFILARKNKNRHED